MPLLCIPQSMILHRFVCMYIYGFWCIQVTVFIFCFSYFMDETLSEDIIFDNLVALTLMLCVQIALDSQTHFHFQLKKLQGILLWTKHSQGKHWLVMRINSHVKIQTLSEQLYDFHDCWLHPHTSHVVPITRPLLPVQLFNMASQVSVPRCAMILSSSTTSSLKFDLLYHFV